jgi:hypothetical protein
MMNVSRTYVKRAFVGVIAATMLGVSIVATCNTIRAIDAGMPIRLWNDASFVQLAIAGAPSMMLALLGVRARRPWIIAVGLTFAFWGYYAYRITRPDEGGGADIGLGILMLFSPLLIAVASLLSLLLSRGRPMRR